MDVDLPEKLWLGSHRGDLSSSACLPLNLRTHHIQEFTYRIRLLISVESRGKMRVSGLTQFCPYQNDRHGRGIMPQLGDPLVTKKSRECPIISSETNELYRLYYNGDSLPSWRCFHNWLCWWGKMLTGRHQLLCSSKASACCNPPVLQARNEKPKSKIFYIELNSFKSLNFVHRNNDWPCLLSTVRRFYTIFFWIRRITE